MLTAKTRWALEHSWLTTEQRAELRESVRLLRSEGASWVGVILDTVEELLRQADAADALRASLSGSQGQWQPIESAPKDRSLVYVPHFGITIALPCSDGTWWSDEVPDQTCLPTLWWPMPPLPPPPADPTTGR
jgi:hypothetical protein